MAQATAEDQPRQEESASDSNDARDRQDDRTIDLTPALKDIEAAISNLVAEKNQIEAEARQERESRDLDAQEAMAKWAKWMFYATTATVLLTFFALLAIVRTLHHTRRAADSADGMLTEAKATTIAAQENSHVTQRIGEAQVRAYLSITRVTLTVAHISQDDVRWQFGVFIKNSGQSPARKVGISAEIEGQDRVSVSSLGLGDIPSATEVDEVINKGTGNVDLKFIGKDQTHVQIKATVKVSGSDVFGCKIELNQRLVGNIHLIVGETITMDRMKHLDMKFGPPFTKKAKD
ncbi:hypothetical protein [Yoonia rosea]|uniref:hypothetical protein n=1 Tax=Yoonia rosea TaxID=287098 RepID=UPI0010563841|nr:hypothetical protein [Yoonia rosea]